MELRVLQNIKDSLQFYQRQFPQDKSTIEQLTQLIDSGAKVTRRDCFQGHITCSAVLIGSDNNLLMIHHKALDKWLFPGGHLEIADVCLRQAALRELQEETGICQSQLTAMTSWLDDMPIHLSCHTIAQNSDKQEPAHEHWDFRYVFKIKNNSLPAIILQQEEVIDFSWTMPVNSHTTIVERLQQQGIITASA